MKKLYLLTFMLLLCSCGSYLSMNSFYNRHKNDANVTAVRVPTFMFVLLQGLSPEMNGIIGNVNDIRYMQLRNNNKIQSEQINLEVNQIISDKFVEIYRKNEELKRTVYSVREKGPVVREVVMFSNDGTNSTILYLNGNFDPVQIRAMAKNQDFESLSSSLKQQYNFNSKTPGITQ